VLTVPCGMTGSGLPFGIQIVSRSGDEMTALQLGQAWQDRTAWHTLRPACIR
jgi:aspartyl-tRNA(Asn)/glutamyl-tRNA(Gln) amidotransferase subunit A